jgi:hypothetical protein
MQVEIQLCREDLDSNRSNRSSSSSATSEQCVSLRCVLCGVIAPQVFGANPDRVVDGFSEEFEEGFMDHLRRA